MRKTMVETTPPTYPPECFSIGAVGNILRVILFCGAKTRGSWGPKEGLIAEKAKDLGKLQCCIFTVIDRNLGSTGATGGD